MSEELVHRLWLFFVAFWDDHITNPGQPEERVHINARTVRVLRELYGSKVFDELCESWHRDGTIRILGEFDALSPEHPCIEVLGYVKENELDTPTKA